MPAAPGSWLVRDVSKTSREKAVSRGGGWKEALRRGLPSDGERAEFGEAGDRESAESLFSGTVRDNLALEGTAGEASVMVMLGGAAMGVLSWLPVGAMGVAWLDAVDTLRAAARAGRLGRACSGDAGVAVTIGRKRSRLSLLPPRTIGSA